MLSAFARYLTRDEIRNNLSKLSYQGKADDDIPDQEQELDEEGEHEDEELITIGLFLKPGDLVELNLRGREPTLAVFVQELGIESQFYSVNGKWCHHQLRHISFAVPGAVDPALLQPLLPYMPTQVVGVTPKNGIQVPREIGAPIQEMLQQLTRDSERIYRKNASILDNAWPTLADTTRDRMMTLSQIAKALLAKKDPTWSPSAAALLAVRKALQHNNFRFRSDVRSQRLTNVFIIRPRDDVERVEMILSWVRDYREHQASLANPTGDILPKESTGAKNIREFVDKAKRLVVESRTRRQPNPGFLGPDQLRDTSTQQPGVQKLVWGEAFTKSDQQIISFLSSWALADQFAVMAELHSACTSIVHAIGLYDEYSTLSGIKNNAAGKQTGYLLLQEIGVITPFENRILYNETLMLPTVRLSRNLELLNIKAESTRRKPDFCDAMRDTRRDWGSTTVYCIDDAGAREIDDGVSIERVPGKPSEYWIHIHVANPTAFFDKTHVLSGLAAHMTETVYTPERTFAMLPAWVSQNYFSLGNNRPAITFSARIDEAGSMLETKIQHGIIRNVVSITPDEVSSYLGEEISRTGERLVVGGPLPATQIDRRPPRLTAEQLQELRDMYAAARFLFQGRKDRGARTFDLRDYLDVCVHETPSTLGLNWMPPSTDRVRRVHGDPIVEVRGRKSPLRFTEDGLRAAKITEEMMLLGNRIAASWCAERNIPVLFRGTVEPPNKSMNSAQYRKQILLPQLERRGFVSYRVAVEYLEAAGRSLIHSSPIPHTSIGAEAYVKATSPLRRFSDMVTHWQIEAALRYEARTGHKLNAKTLAESPHPILPFSQRQIQESIITLSPREKLITSVKTRSNEFWAVQAFMRAFHYKEAPLPDTFIGRIRPSGGGSTMQWYTNCTLDGYSVKALMLVEHTRWNHDDLHVGDRWEVEIDHIDVHRGQIFVLPLRLISRDEGY